MDILGVKYEFGPSVFYLFGPSVKNLVLRFSVYSVLRIRSTVPARFSIDLALRIQHNGPVQFVFCVLWLNIVSTMVLFIPHSVFF